MLGCRSVIEQDPPEQFFLNSQPKENGGVGRYVLGIDEADAFSERLEKELTALDTANVHAILENGPLVDEVSMSSSSYLVTIV